MSNSEHPDDLPKMTVEPGNGAAEKDFRAREKRESTVSNENEGLPSVNRRKGGNKLVTMAGFVFIIVAGLAMIVAVNSKHGDGTPKEKQIDQIGNAMPPLVMPNNPPPPLPAEPPMQAYMVPAPHSAKTDNKTKAPPKLVNGKPVLDWSDRKMSGPILEGQQSGNQHGAGQGGGQRQQAQATQVNGQPATFANPHDEPARRKQTALGASLEPTSTKSVQASVLQHRDFLITKGTSLDCALETAIDSSLPGITTCRLTRDVYSDDGRVLLLDRGSKLVGEYQGGVQQGQTRIFALWTRVETPKGVIINLNSPGTDALGRSGLSGFVDNHFFKRFGAAILMSFINGSVSALANSSQGSSSNTTNIYGDTANGGNKVIEKILDSTVNIPPTIILNQGAHIQVMVARDLDFSTVYGLKATQ